MFSICTGMSICWGLSQVISYIIRDLHTHRRAALLTFFSITYKWLLIGVKALIITLLSLSLPPLLIGQKSDVCMLKLCIHAPVYTIHICRIYMYICIHNNTFAHVMYMSYLYIIPSAHLLIHILQPLFIGILNEAIFLNPVSVSWSETPVYPLFRCWALGVIYMKG